MENSRVMWTKVNRNLKSKQFSEGSLMRNPRELHQSYEILRKTHANSECSMKIASEKSNKLQKRVENYKLKPKMGRKSPKIAQTWKTFQISSKSRDFSSISSHFPINPQNFPHLVVNSPENSYEFHPRTCFYRFFFLFSFSFPPFHTHFPAELFLRLTFLPLEFSQVERGKFGKFAENRRESTCHCQKAIKIQAIQCLIEIPMAPKRTGRELRFFSRAIHTRDIRTHKQTCEHTKTNQRRLRDVLRAIRNR
jgi:hypothetical protein